MVDKVIVDTLREAGDDLRKDFPQIPDKDFYRIYYAGAYTASMEIVMHYVLKTKVRA